MKKVFLTSLFIVVIFSTALYIGTNNSSASVDKSGDKFANKLDSQIELLNIGIKNNSQNIQNYIDLSSAYLQKVRETLDISYYQKIQDLMAQAEKIDAKNIYRNSEIPALLGSVEIGKHHFKEGKNFAEKAIELNKNNYLYYGLLGDAEIELGEYTEATNAFQQMVNLRPGYAAYVRIAYIRELYGDIPGAKKFLQLAIDSGSSFKENIAFAYVELGKLEMRDNLELGKNKFEQALAIVPDYPPALESLGKIAYFKNDATSSKIYFKLAYDKLSTAQYATDLADLLNSSQYLTLAQIAYQKNSQSGVNTDLEESLFLSDHNLDLENSLAKAKSAYTERPSIYAADYYSWAIYKNYKDKNLTDYKDLLLKLKTEAFRLGENDPLILLHQGLIAQSLGDYENAKKYLDKSKKINPYVTILNQK